MAPWPRRRTLLLALAPALLAAALIAVGAGRLSRRSAASPPAQSPDSLVGRLLVAAPDMGDPHFARTVVLVVRHDANGAMGLVVNRVLGSVPLAQLLEAVGESGKGVKGEIAVHYGGPVQPQLGFVLHTTDYSDDTTLRVGDHYAVSHGTAVLRAIAAGKGPRRSFFALGYAGWGAGQLEQELRAGAWALASPNDRLLFGTDQDSKWQRALEGRELSL